MKSNNYLGSTIVGSNSSERSFLQNMSSPFRWAKRSKQAEEQVEASMARLGTPWKPIAQAVSQHDENDEHSAPTLKQLEIAEDQNEDCSFKRIEESSEDRSDELKTDMRKSDEIKIPESKITPQKSEQSANKKSLFSGLNIFRRNTASKNSNEANPDNGLQGQSVGDSQEANTHKEKQDVKSQETKVGPMTLHQSTASGQLVEFEPLMPSTPTLSDVNLNIDLLSEVNLDQKIGEGGCGQVFKGRWKGQPVAIKFLHQALQVAYPKREEEMFETELRLMTRKNHPNIVKCYGACRTPPNRAIIMEYVNGQNLHQYIHNRTAKVKPINTAKIIKYVAKGLQILHPEAIHRDIKPANILLQKGSSGGTVKITDFGLSGIREGSCIWTENCRGTPMYIAPEVYQKKRVDQKADIFSLGIVAWECVSKQKAWDGYGEAQIMYRVAELQERPVIPDDCPQELRELIQRCWAQNPDDRPLAQEVIQMCNQMVAKWTSSNQ